MRCTSMLFGLCLGALAAAAPAAAFTPAAGHAQTPQLAQVHDNYMQVRDERAHRRAHRRARTHHRYYYVPGRHYRHAPHGWHRHHARPHDWQRRGCVIVGPVWFCP